MKKFLMRILFFGIIFLLNALFIIIIDPYNLFFDSNFIEDDFKILSLKRSNEAMPRGNALWKLNEFKKDPFPNIIIGDSRAMGFNTKLINEITDTKYYNFGIPGGNYKTIRDVFWFANDKVKLKNVVIQVGFHTYSKKSSYELVKDIVPYYNHPYKMFFKNWFFFDSFSALQLKILYKPIVNDTSNNLNSHNKNFANWDEVIQRQGYKFLTNYEYPKGYYNELKGISNYCRRNNIHLTFVILPSHPDYYRLVDELNLSNEREKFISDIKEMGKTFDYSSSEKLTTNKMLYYDLYHLKHEVIDSLTYEIWK